MPTSLFHLNVSKKIAEKYPKYDTPNFYIGSIAPDAVNLNGFAEKGVRWTAHKRAKDLDEWKSNIIEFYNKEQKNFENDYLLGYVVHILTDIVVDEMYYKEGLYEDIIKTRATEEEAFKFFKDQIQIYENSQLNELWWKDVKNKLQNCTAFDINNISRQEIIDWKNWVLAEYNDKSQNPYDYVTPFTIDECTKKVLYIIEEILYKSKN